MSLGDVPQVAICAGRHFLQSSGFTSFSGNIEKGTHNAFGRHDCSHALRACAMALALVFFASASPAGAQDDKDIALTKDLVQSFIAAQKDLSDISAKLEKESEKPDEAVQAELEDVAKKHGFKSFDELDAVSTAVSNVMAGLDPDTGEFTNPKEAMQKELSDIKADKDIPAEEKKLLEEELTDAINNTPNTIPSENIEVVKSMRKEIEASMTVDGSASDGAAPSGESSTPDDSKAPAQGSMQ